MKNFLIFALIIMISCDKKKSINKNDENLYKKYSDSFISYPNKYNFFLGKIKYMLKVKSEKDVYNELILNKDNPKYDFYYIQSKLEKKHYNDEVSYKTIDKGICFYEDLFKKNNDTSLYLLNKYLLLSIRNEEKSLNLLKKEIYSLKLKDSVEEYQDMSIMIKEINKTDLKNL